MSTIQKSTAPASERMRYTHPLRRVFIRPEIGGVVGSIAVWIFFAIIAGSSGFLSLRGTSSYLSVAAEITIQAVPVTMLMIAGEFDLSIGSTLGACGMIITIMSAEYGFNIWVGIIVAFVFAILVGLLNGYLVLRTGLPSFIVTLGTQYAGTRDDVRRC